MSADASTATTRSVRARVILGSIVGTALEWYDFFLYGTAAALVFGKIFFPSFEPLTGTLLAFGTFAVGFIARPIGAIVFGHFGDRIGRKQILVVTLALMGVATALMGLIPAYETIGVWAPILLTLFRFVQGFALGGEWGGAVLMSLEHAKPNHRALAASWPQVGAPIGLLLSNGAIALMLAITTEEQFLEWGWRVPFIVSVVLVAVGLWIRLNVTESPEFTKVAAAGNRAKLPVLEVLRTEKKNVLIAVGSRIGTDVTFYTFVLFIVTYVTQVVGLSNEIAMLAVLIGAGVIVALIPLFGALCDVVGRRPVYLAGAIAALVWVFAFFPLLDTAETLLIVVAAVVGMISWAAMFGALASFTTELFPARVRYSGASLGFQLAGILGGGLAPIVSVWLYAQFGSWLPIALYVSSMLAITIISIAVARETKTLDADPSRVSVEAG